MSNDLIVQRVGAKNNVGIIRLNRPKVNALSPDLLIKLSSALRSLDEDQSIRAIVITGSEKVFSGGSDIKLMDKHVNSNLTHEQVFTNNSKGLSFYRSVESISKPIIAAVNGIAYGGGCEIAMLSDIVYAGETAKFGQPEIVIATIPGAGGTQRLPRFTSKSVAMEMVLSGQPISAQEAQTAGLVSKVFPDSKVVSEAVKLAEKIAEHSPFAVARAKKAVNLAYETSLQQGLEMEGSIFQNLAVTNDHKEGMKAFLEKRKPRYQSKL